MEQQYRTRLGRPPKSDAQPERLPVEPVEIIGQRPNAHNCKACGKGQHPTVLETREGYRILRCSSCARRYKFVDAWIELLP
jgi:ribosomal protein L37AE/L43A